MMPEVTKIKGIHPGVILKRELKRRGLKNKELADSIEEHAQTIGAIIKEKRGINPKLSIKLGEKLGVENDYFMLLQSSYDVRIAQNISSKTPNLMTIRKSLFWDTDFYKIDWIKKRKAVIKRILERGNDKEIKEIIAFYGIDVIKKELENIKDDFFPSFNHNVRKYLDVHNL
jgi:addiction module HigA family antidote